MRFSGALGAEDRNGEAQFARYEPLGPQSKYAYDSEPREPRGAAASRRSPRREPAARPPLEETESWRVAPNARREELLEAFARFCQHLLLNDDRLHAIDYLKNTWGFSRGGIEVLGLGVYPSQEAVIEELLRLGFHSEEIADAAVAGDRRLEGRVLVPWRDRGGRLCTIAALSEETHGQGGDRTLFLRGGAKIDPYCADRAAAGPVDHLVLAEGVLETAFLQSLGLENVVTFGSVGKLVSARLWEHLAAMGVRRVTLAFGDDDNGRARTLIALREAAAAKAAPEVFSTPVGALGTAMTPANFARRRGLDALVALFEQQHHGFTYAAAAIAARRENGAYIYQDAAVLGVLEEALDFEAAVDDVDQAELLERFFWPTLFRDLGISWDELRRRYGPRMESLEARRRRVAQLRLRKRLIRDLQEAARKEDLRLIDALIASAADEIRGGRSERTEPAKAKIDRDDWVVEPEFGKDPNEEEVRLAAYYMWQAAGRPEGRQDQYWSRAEKWLRGDRSFTPIRDVETTVKS